ncbi:ribosome biogenesis GTP-binding protein YihA/YsxC [Candidatus Berkiella aquae]|uniref:Probable GTP-binding protein EngB n=1 Tax=Candidatus Berkiella aquae TaxID=295108 RepID=A0A0Q9YYL9_9GAMM|nr:ribosome biogenesis GTP-binding protein YihA/YsxC [Candidatus Berkiella aquae]MCS5712735.1 ribosome biogenesis GTP-binding protein YihA/YsxC [Candidatus Berkiella aquae]
MVDPNVPPPSNFSFSNVSFIKSAPTLAQSPMDTGIEIAFVGRSNAGKSSAINTITGRDGLARTSKTPGRTQLMNYFYIDENRRLVDLPGYGYAKVPERVQREIEELLSSYLSQRQCLQGVILLMDIRHPLMEADKRFLDFAQQYDLPIHILLTKCDKLSRGKSNLTLIETRKELSAYPNVTAQTFSATHRIGLEEIYRKLDEWFNFDDVSSVVKKRF